MFVYYFTGNLIFGIILYMTVMLWVDRPIYAMINLSRDVEEAQRSTEYKITSYINFFKGEYAADLDE
jgi:hypothetical protein